MSAITTKACKQEKRCIKDVIISFLKWILIIFFAVYTLFPLIWLFITSLKTNAEYFNNPFSLPAVPQFQNYINAFTKANLGRMISNSVIVA
ncbi:MAG: carbohydrate ABC transporter permease, partial [Ruminiclostridium sp.]